jgi:hypothetical protein
MELTRRDALAALTASGVAVGAGAVLTGTPFADEPSPEERMNSLLAVAEVVYPAEITGVGNADGRKSSVGNADGEKSGVEEFVRTYALGRTEDRPEYREGMVEALDTLDEYARAWHDADFRELDRETRASVLDQMGVDAADPDPDGLDPGRVRYYVVNELLYALFTSPTGGRLVGIENPQGHPGGTSSYQRGPRGANRDGGGSGG